MMEQLPQIEWVIILEAEEGKFWLDQASDEVPWPPHESVSLISPAAYQKLKALLQKDYAKLGLDLELLRAAFREYYVHQELPDSRLQLVAVQGKAKVKPEQVFALPVFDINGEGPYEEFIDHLEQLQLLKIRAQGHPAEYDTLDMEDDLRSSISLSYSMGRDLHVEDEIFEILAWHPFGND
jgi:hypothetical protein